MQTGSDHHQRGDPVRCRRVVDAGRRVADRREHGEPDDDDRRAGDVTARDRLVGQQVAERQRPHDRGHEQRLDDRHPAAVERSRLQRHAETLRRQTEQPHAVRQQPDEPAGITGSDTRIHRGALPQRRREGERHRGDECEDRGNRTHRTRPYVTTDAVRRAPMT